MTSPSKGGKPNGKPSIDAWKRRFNTFGNLFAPGGHPKTRFMKWGITVSVHHDGGGNTFGNVIAPGHQNHFMKCPLQVCLVQHSCAFVLVQPTDRFLVSHAQYWYIMSEGGFVHPPGHLLILPGHSPSYHGSTTYKGISIPPVSTLPRNNTHEHRTSHFRLIQRWRAHSHRQ